MRSESNSTTSLSTKGFSHDGFMPERANRTLDRSALWFHAGDEGADEDFHGSRLGRERLGYGAVRADEQRFHFIAIVHASSEQLRTVAQHACRHVLHGVVAVRSIRFACFFRP